MAAKRVEVLEAEVIQLKVELEGKMESIKDSINTNFEGKFNALEEMMRNFIKSQSRATPPEEKTEGSGTKGKEKVPPEEGREGDVEILGSNGGIPPREYHQREVPYERPSKAADHFGRPQGEAGYFDRYEEDTEYMDRPRGGAGHFDRPRGGADPFDRPRRRIDHRRPRGEEVDWREESGMWDEPITWERGGRGGGRTCGMDSRPRKLKMPVFEEGNVDDWIHKVERYFAVNGMTEEERLVAAGMCLEGAAFSWYKYMEKREPARSWREFKWAIRERFRGSSPWELYEQFYALTQEGTVEEYRKKFESCVGNLDDLPQSTLEGNYMKGLKPEIRDAVKTFRPRDLREAMEIAQLVENQKQNARGWRGQAAGGSTRTVTTYLAPKGPAPLLLKDSGKERTGGSKPGGNFKKLTEAEMQEKRAKGLCFRCDEKFTPGHRCKDRALQALTVYIDEALEEGDEGIDEELELEEKLHLEVVEVSLNSVMGFTPNRTMKVRGMILGMEVVVLIDSGATHNFISKEVAEKLGVKPLETSSYGVMMGSGKMEPGMGICRGLQLTIQEI